MIASPTKAPLAPDKQSPDDRRLLAVLETQTSAGRFRVIKRPADCARFRIDQRDDGALAEGHGDLELCLVAARKGWRISPFGHSPRAFEGYAGDLPGGWADRILRPGERRPQHNRANPRSTRHQNSAIRRPKAGRAASVLRAFANSERARERAAVDQNVLAGDDSRPARWRGRRRARRIPPDGRSGRPGFAPSFSARTSDASRRAAPPSRASAGFAGRCRTSRAGSN